MQNLEVMVMLFTMVILGYTACKLGYMGDKFDKKLSSIHASGVFRHNVLYEVRQKSLTHDRSDIHHYPVLHHYHSSHHPAFWSIE